MSYHLKIDLSDLMEAFESGSGEAEWYLDRDSGEVIMVVEGMPIDERDIDLEEERYLSVPTISSRGSYAIMEEFIATVKDDGVRTDLEDAIKGKGAFRRFKDVLNHYPEDRKRWFAFKEAAVMQEIMAWLAEEDITLM